MADDMQVAGTPATIQDPQQTAREEIEHTRARMSETIDEIEDVLLRKKHQIQGRLDVLAPIRERPLASVGVVLGAGVLLGLLTGGRDDEYEMHRFHHDTQQELEKRAETWERRARRLLKIAQEQEEEIEVLSRRSSRTRSAKREDEEHRGHSRHRLRDTLTERLTDLATDAVRQLFVPGRVT